MAALVMRLPHHFLASWSTSSASLSSALFDGPSCPPSPMLLMSVADMLRRFLLAAPCLFDSAVVPGACDASSGDARGRRRCLPCLLLPFLPLSALRLPSPSCSEQDDCASDDPLSTSLSRSPSLASEEERGAEERAAAVVLWEAVPALRLVSEAASESTSDWQEDARGVRGEGEHVPARTNRTEVPHKTQLRAVDVKSSTMPRI